MPLVDELPFQRELNTGPPTRLDMADIAVPSNVDLTLVGAVHDGRLSTPDYVGRLFRDHDVLLLEGFDWNSKIEKRVQRISRGYANAMEEQLAIDEQRALDPSVGERGQALWELAVHKALYKSGVRVLMTDVRGTEDRKDHHTPAYHAYRQAIVGFTKAAATGLPITEAAMTAVAARDLAIARAVCERIAEVRRMDTKLDPDAPLKAVGLYGSLHVDPVAAALTWAAERQGVESFTVGRQFELMVPDLPQGMSAERIDGHLRRIGRIRSFYADWLRSEPAEPEKLWHPVTPDS